MRPRPVDVAAIAAIAVIAWRYLTRLDSFLINDDEGSYLYAAWRIALGELPYRDFLTPQLPGFLLPGGAMMHFAGPNVLAARFMAAALAIGAAIVLWATLRRIHGGYVALLAPALLLLQPDVFEATRTFRSEPFMLFFIVLGTWAFLRAVLPQPEAVDPPDRRWLALAGVLFGLSTLTKLFGAWPLGGLLLWLADDARRRQRDIRATVIDAGATLLSCAAVVAIGLGAFALTSDAVYAATVDHHVRQGAGSALMTTIDGGLLMLGLVIRDAGRAAPLALALAAAVAAWRGTDPNARAARVWAWQLPTIIVLLALSRDRYPRHLLYIWPAVAALSAGAIVRLAGLPTLRRPDVAATLRSGLPTPRADGFARLSAVALTIGIVGSWWLHDRDYLWSREEDGTWRVADLIALTTEPDELVLSDYSELNFYAKRPTTYSAASLSSGAVRSGQISWQVLKDEIRAAGRLPALVVLEVESPYSHLSQLSPEESAQFASWLDEHYEVAGSIRRGPQRYEVHTALDQPSANGEVDAGGLPVVARFEQGPTLLGVAIDTPSAPTVGGAVVTVRTAWRGTGFAPNIAQAEPSSDPAQPSATEPRELALTIRLVDATGREVAQIDGPLMASPGRTTDRWSPGELSAERLSLVIPPGTPPGRHELLLGMYDRDGTTLSASRVDGTALGAFVPIGAIEVAPWKANARTVRKVLNLSAPPADVPAAAGWSIVGLDLPQETTLTCGDVVTLDTAWRLDAGPDHEERSTAMEAKMDLWLAHPTSGEFAAQRTTSLVPPGLDPHPWPAGTVIRRRLHAPILPGDAGVYELYLDDSSVLLAAFYATGSYSSEDPVPRPQFTAAPLAELSRAECERDDLSFDMPEGLDGLFDVTFGDVGNLIGIEADDGFPLSGPYIVDLWWRAIGPSEAPLQVTVQLLGPDGIPVAAHDSVPAEGARPTTGWIPGEVIRDRHLLDISALPGPLQPGQGERILYTLVTALYRPTTGTRLPLEIRLGDRSQPIHHEIAPGLLMLGPRPIDELPPPD